MVTHYPPIHLTFHVSSVNKPPLTPNQAPISTDHILNLLPRQSTSDSDSGGSTSCSCPSTIGGGAIAGIVIGSIAGTLLLIWLWRTCMVTSAINEAEHTGTPVVVGNGGYPTNEATTHYRRRRRRSPTYEYSEKPYRSRSGGDRGSVRRPRRVYLTS
ncbi:hypothetical protein BJX68DRAFT_172610 [Aspergillus pseudodeflectus]|uniref:Uncharacterized protein n=1 Tax=Aspergillus pseudodeflectus TaxID=176178 RepID=A0ABR4JN97_9EURO